ncbi:MAG: SDR family NAD(P)-dependent oxidoreductase [Gammaproteobacteria bacterium]
MQRLAGRVAVITGAGQGVGLGIAQAFAAEGATIVMTGRDRAKLEAASASVRAEGAEVLIVPGNVRERAHAKDVMARTMDRFGRLDVLVNNAQTMADTKPFMELSDDDFESVIGSGLFGTIYMMQEAFPYMKERGGSIINLGSREGVYGNRLMAAYSATKEGIRGITRAAARDLGQHGIRVNVVNPAALSPNAAEFLESHPKEAEMYRRDLSLGYFGDSRKDIGPVCVFLASDDAHYLTGQTLNADGGQVML